MPTGPYAVVNAPYPNRVALYCNDLVGPFVQPAPGVLGDFNPIRDLEIWINGSLGTIQTWTFDVANNRYLMYMTTQFDTQGIVQVIHHMPNPAFTAEANPPIFDLTPGDEPGESAGG